MPDTYTAHLTLTKPEVGASRDTWGTKTNANWDTLDQFVSQAMPIGALLDFAGPNAPSGWLIADGRTVSRTTYSALFAVIGTYWGAGDGSTTFNLPGTNGRAAIGPGTGVDANGTSYSYSFTQKLGAVNHVVAQVNLPNISLTTNTTGQHSHGGGTTSDGAHTHTTDGQGSHSHGGVTSTETTPHTHNGTTDGAGTHAHTVPSAWGAAGGPAGVAGGGIATGNALPTTTDGFHAHTFTTSGELQTHVHVIAGDGYHTHTAQTAGAHGHTIYLDGNHAHTVSLGGSGTALTIVQPVLVVTKIIYAGNQAAVMMAGLSLPDTLSAQAADSDELAAIRTELAELRAILAPPRSSRVMQSPSRGPH